MAARTAGIDKMKKLIIVSLCIQKLPLQGPGACDQCVNVKDGLNCVAECPPCKYQDDDGLCQWCHPNCGKGSDCTGSPRCTGPGAHLGFGGCTECARLLLDPREGIGRTECLNRTQLNCEIGFYFFGGTIRIPSNSSRGSENRRVVSNDQPQLCVFLTQFYMRRMFGGSA